MELQVLLFPDQVEDRVLDGLVDRHPLARVEHQGLLQEVLPLRQTVLKDLARSFPGVLGLGVEVGEGHFFLDEGDLFRGGSA